MRLWQRLLLRLLVLFWLRFAVRLLVHERHESYPDCGLKPFSNNMWEPVKTKARTWQTCKGKLVIIASEWSKSSTCAVSPMALKQDKQKSISTLDKTILGYIWAPRAWNLWWITFQRTNLRYFRAENTEILLVCTDAAISVSIASGRILEQENELPYLYRSLSKWEVAKKNGIFSKGTERERFLGLYASRFLSS